MNILENYKVKFLVSEDIGCDISTSNELLSAYIWEHLYVESAQELLADITDVLNGTINLAGGPSQCLCYSVITATTTDLYGDFRAYCTDPNISPDFSLPTNDFKVIVAAWLNFLINNK